MTKREVISNSSKKHRMLMTIASGKGGVGKTSISLNLALSLLERDIHVCLLDADLGLANVEVLLNLSYKQSLVDFIEGKCSMDDVVFIGPRSLKIIPGGSALERLADFNDVEKKRLVDALKHLQGFDWAIIDAPAGLSKLVLMLLEIADMPVLVVTPEPTSLTDAYSVIKTLQKRRNRGPIYVLVNQVKSAHHAEKVFKRLRQVVHKFLKIPLKSLGYVVLDPNMQEAVSRQVPFVELFSDSPATHCLAQITNSLCSKKRSFEKTENLRALLSPSFFDIADPEDPSIKRSLTPQEVEDQHSIETSSDLNVNEYIVGLLIKEGHVSPGQVEYAKRVQKKLDNPKRLLEIIKELGYARENQIKEALCKNRAGIPLGSLLVELGYISENQLKMALNQQQQDKEQRSLRQLLVENNYITDYGLTQAISLYLGFPYVKPDSATLERSLLEETSTQLLLRHKFLPLRKDGRSITVAMVNPLDQTALKTAKDLFGPDIIPSIAMEASIKETLEAYDSLKKDKSRAKTNKNQVVELVDSIIKEALRKNATDIHIEPMKTRVRVRFRKYGSLNHHMDFSKDSEPEVINQIKQMASASITETRRHQEGRIFIGSTQNGKEVEIQVTFYVTHFGEKVVMRILGKKAEPYDVKDLGMGSKILNRFKEELLDLPTGLIIFTGPTMSGKTTSLYAAINYCNNTDINIITAEEPVEYPIEGISQGSINPKIGLTLEETFSYMLRQDADIIVLGEIRDKFSAESAIQAALTDHKVFTTFHAEDSIGALLRLINMDIDAFLISSTVVGMVAQRLLKKACPHCRKVYNPSPKDLRRLRYQPQSLNHYHFQVGTGCVHCGFTGYQGRIGVFEMLVLNEYVKDAILKNKPSYEIRRISKETAGLVTLSEDGIAKAAGRITSLEEVIRRLPLLEPPRPLDQIYPLIGDI